MVDTMYHIEKRLRNVVPLARAVVAFAVILAMPAALILLYAAALAAL